MPIRGKAHALWALHRPTEALAAFQQAITLDPSFLCPSISQAQLLAELGRYAEALRTLEQAIQLDPTFLPAQTAKSEVLARLRHLRGGEAFAEIFSEHASDVARLLQKSDWSREQLN